MSVIHVATKGRMDVWSLGCRLWSCCCLRAVVPSESHALSPGAMVISGPRLLPRTMSGFMVLPQLGSALISVAHGNIKGHTEAQGLGSNLWLCWCLRAMPLLRPCRAEACAATRDHVWVKAPAAAVKMSTARVATEIKGIMNVEIQGPC